MKKTIKTEELMNAIEKIKAQARGQYESTEKSADAESRLRHGRCNDDARDFVENLSRYPRASGGHYTRQKGKQHGKYHEG